MKIWLKVTLNAVRLPKFEAIHGKSLVSDIAIFVLKRDVKLQLTN